MNEDFAPFELAVKLKEKGFNEPCFGWYYPSEVCGFDYRTTIVFNNSEYRGSNYKDMLVSHKDEKHINAPTIPQVLKWLREEKKIHIIVEIADSGWYYTIYPNIRWENGKLKSDKYIMSFKPKASPEQAALAGIEYTLDNLI